MLGEPYVQRRDGNVYIRGSRVTLESTVYLWLAGRTPEAIQQSFPSVPLAVVYGAIAFYLEHRDEMDAFFAETRSLDASRRAADERAAPERYARLRQVLATRRSVAVETGSAAATDAPSAR